MWPEYSTQQWGISLAHLERRVLASGWLPACLLSNKYDCYDCPLDGVSDCPVVSDQDYNSYLYWLRDRYLLYKQQTRKRIAMLRTILKMHKLPLHWEVLAALAFRQEPDLFESADSIKGLVYSHRDVFFMEEDGVFGLAEWHK